MLAEPRHGTLDTDPCLRTAHGPGCGTIRQPEHQAYALTTYEPARYRLPEHAPATELVRRMLAEVLAQQTDRAEIARRSVTW